MGITVKGSIAQLFLRYDGQSLKPKVWNLTALFHRSFAFYIRDLNVYISIKNADPSWSFKEKYKLSPSRFIKNTPSSKNVSKKVNPDRIVGLL